MKSLKKLLFGILLISSELGVMFALGTFAANDTESPASHQDQFMQDVRINAVKQLVASGFDRFVTLPLGRGNDFMHITGSMTYPDYPDYVMATGIVLEDDLDQLLVEKMKKLSIGDYLSYQFSAFSFDNFALSEEEIAGLKSVYLFKSEQDLKNLGYVVSSYRTRTNTDDSWRADNIFISFRNVGNVRVINPGQEISFMDEIHYDPNIDNGKRDLADGRANV